MSQNRSTADLIDAPIAPKGNSRHSGYDRNRLDWYVEEAFCVDQMLDYLQAEHDLDDCAVYDPACGLGTTLDCCAARGFVTFGSDVVDRGARVRHSWCEHDFLRGDLWRPVAPGQHLAVFCNPPYGRLEENMPRGDTFAERFIRRAHALDADHIAMIVNGKFLWSKRRHRLFMIDHPPTQLLFCSERPSMPPGEMLLDMRERGEAPDGGSLDFLWLYWRKGAAPRPPHWLTPSDAVAAASSQQEMML